MHDGTVNLSTTTNYFLPPQAYVKQLIESRMDCKVPISLQPKHLVDDIMNDAKKHFPEFESCTRKRIRTFLKSCRRSKKFRQQVGDEYLKRSDSALNISPVSLVTKLKT